MLDGNDHELALAAASGDRAAFAALLTRHYDRIYRLAWRWSGRREAAEDIAQDVAVKLATAIGSFRGEAAFTTWAYRIAYLTAVDHVRRSQREVPTSPSNVVSLLECEAGPSPEEQVIGAELWQAVRALPPQQRDAVLLVYGEDVSHAEAATIMGCTEKTVSWHLHEARKRLRTSLEAAG